MSRLLTRSILAAAALAALFAAPAGAHELKKLMKKSTYAQSASFTAARPAAKRVYLGRAPYICGPSGFGRKSTCTLRSGT